MFLTQEIMAFEEYNSTIELKVILDSNVCQDLQIKLLDKQAITDFKLILGSLVNNQRKEETPGVYTFEGGNIFFSRPNNKKRRRSKHYKKLLSPV